MLSKNKIKFIQSLRNKKIRDKSNLYIAEGEKIILEALKLQRSIKHLFCTESFSEAHKIVIGKRTEVHLITSAELKKISFLQTPSDGLALIEMPENKLDIDSLEGQFILALDNLQNPGNLGTIIRIADWYGIRTIVCSNDTVDCYNEKVVQAAMGSLFCTQLYYTSLETFLPGAKKRGFQVAGASLSGKSIYKEKLTNQSCILVIGNEGAGISASIEKLLDRKLSIPHQNERKIAESLNAAVATGIICSEILRRTN